MRAAGCTSCKLQLKLEQSERKDMLFHQSQSRLWAQTDFLKSDGNRDSYGLAWLQNTKAHSRRTCAASQRAETPSVRSRVTEAPAPISNLSSSTDLICNNEDELRKSKHSNSGLYSIKRNPHPSIEKIKSISFDFNYQLSSSLSHILGRVSALLNLWKQ